MTGHQNDLAELDVGEQTDDGYELTIYRGFHDGTSEYTKKYTKINCHGVTDVRIQDPYEMGTRTPESEITVYFTTGESSQIRGVITDIDV